jgi:hypothetical protein
VSLHRISSPILFISYELNSVSLSLTLYFGIGLYRRFSSTRLINRTVEHSNSELGWPLQTHTWEGGEDREAIWRDNPVLPCLLSGVKLLRLGCGSSACGLRRVPALLVFYSSFSSQNTV